MFAFATVLEITGIGPDSGGVIVVSRKLKLCVLDSQIVRQPPRHLQIHSRTLFGFFVPGIPHIDIFQLESKRGYRRGTSY